MKFRTEINIQKAPFQLDYKKHVLMMGSCFTDNIGIFLKNYLFHITINPFGVTYNPLSLLRGIESLLYKDVYSESDLSFYNELYFSFDHYTKYSHIDKEVALANINSSFLKAKEMLLEAGTLILTFGTAYVYEYSKSGQVVNNCHKIPASEFKRRMLSIEEITKEYTKLLLKIKNVNPDLKIIFTLSPVRHIKDGLAENQRSKATLLLSIHEILSKNPEAGIYFPAYEIVMDDLRDYRFYSKDLIHPNDQAIEYIWKLFMENFLGEKEKDIIHKLLPLIKAKAHRPLHSNTIANLDFQKVNAEKARKLKSEFPFLNWTEFDPN